MLIVPRIIKFKEEGGRGKGISYVNCSMYYKEGGLHNFLHCL
jgi:hypothetical protein